MDKLANFIKFGPPKDTPAHVYLERVFWLILTLLQLDPLDWPKLMNAYVNDPRYVGRSQADPKERAGRLVNALTGGSTEGLEVDFTWKRFTESLVLLEVETCTVTVKAKRGRFKVERLARSFFHPAADLLRTLRYEDEEELSKTASTVLNSYFANPKQTADTVMQHVLLKILWQLFAEYKIDATEWKQSVTQYVNNPKNCPDIATRRSDKRHNLQHAIRHTKKISWKRFLEALKAIDVRTMEFTLLCTIPGRPDIEQLIEIDLAHLVFWSNRNEPE